MFTKPLRITLLTEDQFLAQTQTDRLKDYALSEFAEFGRTPAAMRAFAEIRRRETA